MQIGPPITPPIVKNLLIANAVVFVLQSFVPLAALGSVVPYLVVQQGYLWQPFTYMWLHGSLGHVLMNMFVLWMFGSQLAMAWGPQRFLRYYLICGVGAGVLIALVPYVLYGVGVAAEHTLGYRTLGASGAVYGVLLAYSLTWPDRTIMLIFPPVAFRAIWLIPALFLMSAMFPSGNVSHVGHLGGVVVGWLYMRSRGDGGQLFTIAGLKYKWRRYRMRQKLRAVQYEEWEQRRRDQEDRRLH
jgi:membrane associated rhomboid family serine protease